MIVIDIFQHTGDRDTVLCKLGLVEGRVRAISGDTEFGNRLVKDRNRQSFLGLSADPELWMEEFSEATQGTYIWASSPYDDDGADPRLPEGLELAFCPTGPGGGVDPTCSPGSGGMGISGTTEKAVVKELRSAIAAVQFPETPSMGQLDAWLPVGKVGHKDYRFKTSSGRQFEIRVEPTVLNGEISRKQFEVGFQDNVGSQQATGKGEAHEIFGKVVPAVSAFVEREKPDVLTFGANGESRQRLYDRLARSTVKLYPEYSARTVQGISKRYYIVYKSELEDQIVNSSSASLKLSAEPGLPESEVIEPEIDPSWFTEEGWPDLDEPEEE